jgi:hypothetical protein
VSFASVFAFLVLAQFFFLLAVALEYKWPGKCGEWRGGSKPGKTILPVYKKLFYPLLLLEIICGLGALVPTAMELGQQFPVPGKRNENALLSAFSLLIIVAAVQAVMWMLYVRAYGVGTQDES